MQLYSIDSGVAIYENKQISLTFCICVRYKSNHPNGYSIGMLYPNKCFISSKDHSHDSLDSSWEFIKFIKHDVVDSIFETMILIDFNENNLAPKNKSWYRIEVVITKDQFNTILHENNINTF